MSLIYVSHVMKLVTLALGRLLNFAINAKANIYFKNQLGLAYLAV